MAERRKIITPATTQQPEQDAHPSAQTVEPTSTYNNPNKRKMNESKEPGNPKSSQGGSPYRNRRIDVLDPSKIKVKKLVIDLAEEDSSASDDDLVLSSSSNEWRQDAVIDQPTLSALPIPLLQEYSWLVERVKILENEKNQARSAQVMTLSEQLSKENRLEDIEYLFAKVGHKMIRNLDKSLHMIEEAKESKQFIGDLCGIIRSAKQALRQQELKLTRIKPEMKASHEKLKSLRDDRDKLQAEAEKMGSELRGDSYILCDYNKAEIYRKCIQLAKEIELYMESQGKQ